MDVENTVRQLTLEEKAAFCSGYYYWHTKGLECLGIPKVMMCDGPHGLRKQVGAEDHLGLNESVQAVCFPSASALAASFDRNVMEELGTCLGKECQAEHVGMLLGPGVNMKRSPLCGRNFEYFSEDPYLAGELAASYVKNLQKEGVAACVKHFACNNQETDRMSGDSRVDERTLREIYLPAFEKVVKESGVRAVMCAYNSLNGTFCAENKKLLTDILREEWGFQGMVVTDWGAVKGRVKGMEAGLDLEMPGGPGAQDQKIVDAVREGRLDETVLDRTVERILRFVSDCVEQEKETVWNHEDAHRKAVEIAGECMVLLENRDQILPLKKDVKTAFIGEFAVKPRYKGGGSSHVNPWKVTGTLDTALEKGANVLFARGYDTENEEDQKQVTALIEEAVQVAREAEAAVIFAGLPNAYESEGKDRTSLEMPEMQNRLIEAVAEVQPNTVVVLHAGAPVLLPWRDRVKGILLAYLCGEGAGEAEEAILYGRVNPSGKLAETFPLKLEHNPSYLNFPGENGTVEYREGVFTGYRYYDKKALDVAYPFGFGLSYTEFDYDDLRLEKENIKDTETLRVTCAEIRHRIMDECVEAVCRIQEQGNISKPIQACCDYIKAHFNEPIDLKKIAKSVGYTEYYLTKRFQKEMGIKLLDYIKKVRISYAKVWLITNEKSIQEISEILQFTSRNYFTKVFKAQEGMTPAEYRERAVQAGKGSGKNAGAEREMEESR
ncbi:glycoside hydrolase family 3 C-terminal domain-containing protein [Mediterraneibacter glycyrrhizinilyticus]|uniref:glycoside hydrolase family 3 C-terminal domain-containing protein n=1 Tax=Mediterraneibacter glycyrrhizinilyticus TaxID=342942 RepID=UPI00196161E2|nr:glycoside hydrolase family 3 C-terminal domain-containing protein [Mediterraneibacter glycyrrhizinilyticus]MBM6751043.1 glycoside hydrolase family 3 C-terminal domain-containing protein [Mediterraneibacter glycyrrhizinilyticus]